ncbi:CU044_5270 family protein [Lentzea sp. NPDC058436]|uniref:CU044_5270 family protein n=1 Tax=Lentzea sp. NPDC058436 TaxID=3346499 RepID=UPI0036585B2B
MRDETRQVEDETVRWAMSDVAPMSDEAFERGRAALLARIDAEESGAVVPLARRRRNQGAAGRRRRRVPLAAAAAAMVVLAGVALVAPSLVARDRGAGSAAAAELLNQAAGVVGDAFLQPGQYLYVRQDGRWSTKDYHYAWMFLADETSETWIPADRRGTWLHRQRNVGEKQWLIGSAKDLPDDLEDRGEGEWRVEGGRWLGDKIPVSFTDPTTDYIASLPRDPRDLYDVLRKEAGTRNLLLMVTSGLDTGMYPADVRAAVFQALTHLPGLEVVDRAAVLDDRTGTALGLTEHGITEQIVIRPDTGEYLGSRSVQAEAAHGIKAGTVIGTSSLTAKVVSGMGQTS